MIDLKNRTRETRTYQYPATVTAGPVRPTTQKVYRSMHNPRTGKIVRREKEVTLGGVLTLGPKTTLTGLPKVLLAHEGLQRDIAARSVKLTQVKKLPPVTPKVLPTTPARKSRRSRK